MSHNLAPNVALKKTNTILFLAALSCFPAPLVGCGSSDTKNSGTDTGTGTGTGTGTDTSTSVGACKEVPLFAPLAIGTPSDGGGDDLIRAIQVDEANGDIYFSGYADLYRLPAGAAAPSKLMERPAAGDDFWLRTDRILFPSGLAFSLVQDSTSILMSTSRDGSGLTTVVPIQPAAPDPVLWNVTVSSIALAGDNLFWIDKRGEIAITALDTKFTYTVYEKPWASAGTPPKQLYQSSQGLDSLFTAGTDIYVKETVGDPLSGTSRQLRIAAAGGTPVEMAPLVKGDVLDGDDQSILVARSDFDTGSYGIFSMRPDGSNEVKLSDGIFLSQHVSRKGLWGIVDFPGLSEGFPVYTYSTTGGRRSLGCIDSADTTVHAAALTDSALYVSIYRRARTTILRFSL